MTKIVVEPAVCIAGTRIRAIVAVDFGAIRVARGGIAGHGEKRPVAIVVGSGSGARLLALDGTAIDCADLGLSRGDIA